MNGLQNPVPHIDFMNLEGLPASSGAAESPLVLPSPIPNRLRFDAVTDMVVTWMRSNGRQPPGTDTTSSDAAAQQLGVWQGLNDRLVKGTWRYSVGNDVADPSWQPWAPGTRQSDTIGAFAVPQSRHTAACRLSSTRATKPPVCNAQPPRPPTLRAVLVLDFFSSNCCVLAAASPVTCLQSCLCRAPTTMALCSRLWPARWARTCVACRDALTCATPTLWRTLTLMPWVWWRCG